MEPIGVGEFLAPTDNSLLRPMNSLLGRKKFPASAGQKIWESACNALQLQRELTRASAEMAGNL
jgi:hypothetical protein